MFRRNLIELLLDHPMTLGQIARETRVHPREIEADLEHLRKSLRHTEFKLEVEPAACRKCGFQFAREKIRKPSKCPDCRSTWIAEAEFAVRRPACS